MLAPSCQVKPFVNDRGIWVAIVAFSYAGIYLVHHIGTPLGQVEVLDGREIIAWANVLARGEWPGEPFFRAPLYPLLLAAALKLGVPETNVLLTAQLLNLFAHVLSAWLVYQIAGEIWRKQTAALLSGLLFALYPLAVFYVGEPLDISLGCSLFLAGLFCALRGGRPGGFLLSCCAGLLLALAVACRPHFLSAAIALLATPALLCSQPRARFLKTAVMLAGLLFGLLCLGTLNAWQSGQFQVLPSQGAYNLWAANRLGANGRFYEQQLNYFSHDQLANTARLESVRLYQLETGNHGADPDYGAIASYWRRRAVAEIRAQPLDWLLLELRKLAALTHNTEQYNNKTFAFHKARSPILKLNPLAWGLLLTAACASLTAAWRRRELQVLLLISSCYAAGVLMFYASARFRFPLAPLLCVVAGGLVPLWQQRQRFSVAKTWPWILMLGGLSVFCFFPFQWSQAETTFDQDRLLLARAQAQLGQSQDSIDLLGDILARRKNLPRAWDLLCSTHFNRLRELDQSEFAAVLPDAIEACAKVAAVSTQANWILAFEWWWSGRRQQAIVRWQTIAAAKGPEWQRATACLLLADQSDVEIEKALEKLPTKHMNDLLLLAQSSRGNEAARHELGRRYDQQAVERQRSWLRQVFEIRGSGTQ